MNPTVKKVLFGLLLLPLLGWSQILAFVELLFLFRPALWVEQLVILTIFSGYFISLFWYAHSLGKKYILFTIALIVVLFLIAVTATSYELMRSMAFKKEIVSNAKLLSKDFSSVVSVQNIGLVKIPQTQADYKLSFSMPMEINKLPKELKDYKVEIYQGNTRVIFYTLHINAENASIYGANYELKSLEYYQPEIAISLAGVDYSFNYFAYDKPQVRIKITNITPGSYNDAVLYEKALELPL